MSALLAATLLFPAVMPAALLRPAVRARALDLLAFAPLPGLLAALLARGASPLVFDAYGLRLSLALDDTGALLLGVAALLWSAAGAYAARYLRGDRHAVRFAACWLLTLTGSLGCFLAADLLTFYLAFALVSIPAYGLIIHDGTARAWRAGGITLALKIFGEVCLLLAFALMANAIPGRSLAITDAVAALGMSPRRGMVLGLLLLGFGVKAGQVPLHVWLPLAHPAAPMPASAVLSGAVIKAGILGLIRFLPFDAGAPDWGTALGVIGFATAFHGVLVGITQRNPKAVLAYSSVSQMGVVCAALGLGLAAADPASGRAAASYATHHMLAKGALFLAVGVAEAGGVRQLRHVMVPAVVLALGFGGLPPTGGFIAKLAVKDQLGYGLPGMLSILSAIGSTVLMLHFCRRLRAGQGADPNAAPDRRLALPWLAMAAASIVLPWLLVMPADALDPAALWSATWPVGIGVALSFLLARVQLPRVPEGDIVGIGERAARSLAHLAAPIERVEAGIRHWPVAGTLLLAMAVMLGAAMLGAGP